MMHGYGFDGFGMMGGWGLLGGLVGLFLFLALIGAVVALIVWLVRRPSASEDVARPRERSVKEVLEVRYARGEISREEFLRMREDLGV